MSDMDVLLDRLAEALREPDLGDLRLQPKPSLAVEIVQLVRNKATTFNEAVALIEQYGRACVSEGRCDQAVENYNKSREHA